MKKKGAGFTLIELLVVIAIIGLLVSIAAVAFGPARKKTRDAKRQSEINQINLAMEMCYGDSVCGGGAEKYPDTAAQEIGPDSATWKTIDTDGTPLYLTIPADPLNSGDQQYKSTDGTDQYYCIYVKLENVADTWFCASNKGVFQKTLAGYTPDNINCCGPE